MTLVQLHTLLNPECCCHPTCNLVINHCQMSEMNCSLIIGYCKPTPTLSSPCPFHFPFNFFFKRQNCSKCIAYFLYSEVMSRLHIKQKVNITNNPNKTENMQKELMWHILLLVEWICTHLSPGHYQIFKDIIKWHGQLAASFNH